MRIDCTCNSRVAVHVLWSDSHPCKIHLHGGWQSCICEGANRGIPNAGHTSSIGLSGCCVVCDYAIGHVNTEVVIL